MPLFATLEKFGPVAYPNKFWEYVPREKRDASTGSGPYVSEQLIHELKFAMGWTMTATAQWTNLKIPQSAPPFSVPATRGPLKLKRLAHVTEGIKRAYL
tara:strand:- start:3 stop:299 length:297 start_codon:yes stop_codon:yes gene_type:complete